MAAELPSPEQIFSETSRLVPPDASMHVARVMFSVFRHLFRKVAFSVKTMDGKLCENREKKSHFRTKSKKSRRSLKTVDVFRLLKVF